MGGLRECHCDLYVKVRKYMNSLWKLWCWFSLPPFLYQNFSQLQFCSLVRFAVDNGSYRCGWFSRFPRVRLPKYWNSALSKHFDESLVRCGWRWLQPCALHSILWLRVELWRFHKNMKTEQFMSDGEYWCRFLNCLTMVVHKYHITNDLLQVMTSSLCTGRRRTKGLSSYQISYLCSYANVQKTAWLQMNIFWNQIFQFTIYSIRKERRISLFFDPSVPATEKLISNSRITELS